ncbi:hypothetical protein GCM10008908_23540 [Clostridium subterminale]|uniref:DUF7948 domain-containing protein n=1 Tax=Clostridium subterminale TaxID=1550 RepID=A0ABP3W094_CLOSU
MLHNMDEKVDSNNTYPFEFNNGQNHKDVKYTAAKDGYIILFLKNEIIMGLKEINNVTTLNYDEDQLKEITDTETTNFFKILLKNSLPDVEIIGEREGDEKKNYFDFYDPNEEIIDVPTYSKIRYKGIYHGIDLVFYFNDGNLEYKFILQQGTNPGTINMTFEGIDNIKLGRGKNVEVTVKECKLSILKSSVYQSYSEMKIEVTSEFEIEGNSLSINVGHYDKTLPLVIESALSYFKYSRGEGDDMEYIVEKDSVENAGVNDVTDLSDIIYGDLPVEEPKEAVIEGESDDHELNTLDRDHHKKPDIEDIYNIITNSRYGLAEIKREVRAIERNVKETIRRLEARNREIQCKLDCIIACMNCKRRFTLTTGRVRRACRVANLFINIRNNSRIPVELEIRRKNIRNDISKVCTISIIVGPDSCREVIFRNIPDTYEIEIRGVTEDVRVSVTEVCCGDNGASRQIRLCRAPDPS